MPSPLAHVGVALAARLAVLRPDAPDARRVSLAVAFASIAPDLDILAVMLLPGGLAWHRGPSHSVLGAAVIGLAVALAFRVRDRGSRAVVVLAALLHIPMDWSTGEPGAPSAYGVPWAWPFDPTRGIDADPWFGAYHIDRAGFLANMFAWEALPVYGWELLTVAGSWLAAMAFRGMARTLANAPARDVS